MTEQKRVVKGVWIPIEIWENEHLSIQEKVVLAEIDSFCSCYDSCYASNEHFAKFIGVGARRIQKIIKSLEDKHLVEREVIYKKGTKEIEKRFLRVRYPSCPKVREGGEEKFAGGGVQKFADNNTSMNNTFNNNIYEQNAENKQTKKRKAFTPPTLEELKAYIAEKNFNIDADYFYEYYETTDWHDAKGKKMSNWKLTCLTWDKNAKKYGETNKVNNGTSPSGIRTNADWGAYDG